MALEMLSPALILLLAAVLIGFFNGRADDEVIVFEGGLGFQCSHGNSPVIA